MKLRPDVPSVPSSVCMYTRLPDIAGIIQARKANVLRVPTRFGLTSLFLGTYYALLDRAFAVGQEGRERDGGKGRGAPKQAESF